MGVFEQQLATMHEMAIGAARGDLYSDVATAWLRLDNVLTGVDLLPYEARSIWNSRGHKFIELAKELAYHVIGGLDVPANARREMEKATQVVMQTKTQPRDLLGWFNRLKPHVRLLLKSKDWPEKSEGEQLFPWEGFRVHNVVGLEGDELQQMKDLIAASASAIRSSSIPNASKILYGDLLLTHDLRGRDTLAFYRHADDTVYLRPKTRYGPASEHSLVHELGHRYWLFDFNNKGAWNLYDTNLRATPASMPFEWPKVGERLPGTDLVVLKIVKESPSKIKFYTAANKYVSSRAIQNLYNARAKSAKFPTDYAATEDAEEHFCESFAMRCLGTLPEPHLSVFRRIVG